jgi:hypothetical protein
MIDIVTDVVYDDFIIFCNQAAEETSQPASKNMKSLPTSLDRFKDGEFNFLIDSGKIIGCGGVYVSDFSKNISFAGTRTWINKEYRHQNLIRDYLLPRHKQWSIERGCKQIALCFNDYNKNMRKIFFRNRFGEENSRIFQREARHLFHSNINELTFPVNIQDTAQWILYEKIDPNWEFDWKSIKANVPSTL